MTGDFRLGGGWGRHVSLFHPESFHTIDLAREPVRVWGHWLPRPKVGQTLVGEFQRSHLKFRFEKVELCRDPPDMFFAEVRAVEQVMKEKAS